MTLFGHLLRAKDSESVLFRLAWSFALGAVLLSLFGPPAEASAWNRYAGDGLAIVDYTFSGGSRYFNGLGHLAPARSYDKSEVAGYIEYGITDWLMAVARPSLVSTSIGAPDGGHYMGLGSSQAGAQLHVLTFGPAVLAAQGTFSLPPTSSQKNPAQVGNTAREAQVRGLMGVGFLLGPWRSFVDAQAGYAVRSNGAPDEWHADLTLGVEVRPHLLMLVQNFNTIPQGSGTAWFPRSRYSKLGLTAVYDLNAAWSIELGVFQTVGGTDALRERGFKTGIWYRF